jgi:predicted MFS family arabinose efflux permease
MSRPGRRLGPAVAALGFIKLVVNTAFRFVYPFLPAIARGLGIDLTQAGMLVSVRWASGLATPVVMSLSGQVHRSRRLVIAGLLLFSAGSLVTAWSGVFVGAVVGFALLGLAKPLVDISSQVYVSERVGYEDRARYLGILEIAWAGGLLLGAPMAGWLIGNWSWEAPFWVVGWLGVLGIGLALLFLDAHDEVPDRAARAADSPGRQVILLLGTLALFGFAHEALMVTLGGWLEGSFGMTLLGLGGVGTMIGLSELAGEGAMVGFTDRIGKRNSLALGLGVATVSLFALSFFSEQLAPAMAALVVTTISLEFGYISAIPLMTELRPRARTRVLGLSTVASALGRIASDFISPRVFAARGMEMVTIMAGTVALVALVVVLGWAREVSPGERVAAAREG